MLKGRWAAPYATDFPLHETYRHKFDIRGGASNDEMHQCSLKGSSDPDLISAALSTNEESGHQF